MANLGRLRVCVVFTQYTRTIFLECFLNTSGRPEHSVDLNEEEAPQERRTLALLSTQTSEVGKTHGELRGWNEREQVDSKDDCATVASKHCLSAPLARLASPCLSNECLVLPLAMVRVCWLVCLPALLPTFLPLPMPTSRLLASPTSHPMAALPPRTSSIPPILQPYPLSTASRRAALVVYYTRSHIPTGRRTSHAQVVRLPEERAYSCRTLDR